jgi:hypothetical protein
MQKDDISDDCLDRPRQERRLDTSENGLQYSTSEGAREKSRVVANGHQRELEDPLTT